MKKESIPVFALALEEATVRQDPEIASKLIRYLMDRRLTFCVAESVTGGALSRQICAVPGASQAYLGGAVAYHTRLKVQWCGVSPKTITTHGLVSAPTVVEMASGVRKTCQASIGIATTGIAGPDTSHEARSVGTVFVGIDILGKQSVQQLSLTGTRVDIQEQAAQAALVFCYERLTHH